MRETGRWGERVAETYLRAQGYTILKRNAFYRIGELDLVAQKGQTVHVCEVKTRTGIGHAATALTPQKRQRLRKAAVYLSHQLPNVSAWCCDLISVEVNPSTGGVKVTQQHDTF